jgi:hypothetical protein
MLVPSCSHDLSVPIDSLLLNTFHPASDISGIGSIGEIPAENNGEARRIEKRSCWERRRARRSGRFDTRLRHFQSNRRARQYERAEPLAGALAGRLEITQAFRTERSVGGVTDAHSRPALGVS